MNEAEYNRLKAAAEEKKKEADRAEGAAGEQLRALQAEFGHGDLDALENLLAELEKEEVELGKVAQEKFDKFKQEWGSLL
jgi:hypothetical protein